jgi:hypothetical protein
MPRTWLIWWPMAPVTVASDMAWYDYRRQRFVPFERFVVKFRSEK